jgi:hypothetical protein
MTERYQTQHRNTSPSCPEHQGVIHDKTMSSVKGAAPTLDLAGHALVAKARGK